MELFRGIQVNPYTNTFECFAVLTRQLSKYKDGDDVKGKNYF